MTALARAAAALLGVALAVYPVVLHATPAGAVLSSVAGALALLAALFPRRSSGGPAVLVWLVAYAAALVARGHMDPLAPVAAGGAYLFVESVALAGTLAGGASTERAVLGGRLRSGLLLALAGGVAAAAALAMGTLVAGSGTLAFLVAGTASGLLLALAAGSKPAQGGPKGQNVP